VPRSLPRSAAGCFLTAALLTPAAASAQGLKPTTTTSPLKRVEPGITDSNPLAVGTRLIPVDLRAPTNFEGVYQFQRTDRFGNSETFFARTDGGLTAVFPRSQYVDSGGNLLAQVPPGTVWLIGGLPKPTDKPAPPRSETYLDLSIRGNISDAPEPEGSPDAAPAPAPSRPPALNHRQPEPLSIWNSERYRRQRVGTLLQSLADG